MKKKSAYRPRHSNPLAHVSALKQISLMPRDSVLKCSLAAANSAQEIIAGQPSFEDWQNLFSCVNLMEELVLMKKAIDEDGMVDRMHGAILALMNRQQAQGATNPSEEEAQVIREIASTHTDMLAGITFGELAQALERADKRVRQARALAAKSEIPEKTPAAQSGREVHFIKQRPR